MYFCLCLYVLYMFIWTRKCFNPCFMASRAVWEADHNCKDEWKAIDRDRIEIRLLLSLLSSELQKIDLEGTRGHLLHPAAPGRINSNETAPDRYLPNFFLKPLTMEILNILWVVTLAASWILAHNQLSYHWDLLYSAQNFIANLRNTGQSGSMGWVDVCVLVCSPGGLIDPFCVNMDCYTPCNNIWVFSTWQSLLGICLPILSLFFFNL